VYLRIKYTNTYRYGSQKHTYYINIVVFLTAISMCISLLGLGNQFTTFNQPNAQYSSLDILPWLNIVNCVSTAHRTNNLKN